MQMDLSCSFQTEADEQPPASNRYFISLHPILNYVNLRFMS